MDERDQLVSQVASLVDVNATYRSDGSVALATRSGVGLLDEKASIFQFTPNNNISATQQFSTNDAQNGVGTLSLLTPAGLSIDLVKQNVLQSGEIAGLLKLRDNTLVQAQNQLDSVAAGLAQSLSTNQTQGTAASSGSASGLSVDLSQVQPGNDILLNYTVAGVAKQVRVVRVDDTTKLPMNSTTNGVQTIGVSFAGGASGVASALQSALGPSLQISGSGSTLTVLNDGTSNTGVSNLTAETTSTADAGRRVGAQPLRRRRRPALYQQPRRHGAKGRLCRPHPGQPVDPGRQHQAGGVDQYDPDRGRGAG